jgi:hypothetical protein
MNENSQMILLCSFMCAMNGTEDKFCEKKASASILINYLMGNKFYEIKLIVPQAS